MRQAVTRLAIWTLLLQFATGIAHSEQAPPIAPRVGIIIDDLGYSLKNGRRSIALPGAVTCSILPGTPYAQKLAQHAKDSGKEIMLHLPMQGAGPSPNEPHSLSVEMTETAFREVLRTHLAAIPEAVGVNNHMGSIVTPLPQQMNWLMEELAGRAIYFVDSRTAQSTAAAEAAFLHQVPFTQRDVFLDNDKDAAAIETAFNQLIRKAKKHGHAIGIAHAHPVTLATLEQLLPRLAEEGIILESVSKLLPRKEVPVENLTAQSQNTNMSSTESTP
jgi:polysaccharide deacetylase 2 family uncharacterized protein YibQ